MDSNGEAFMASVQSSIHTNRTRRTKEEIEAALQASLLTVFSVLSANQLSLREFLIATFSSRQELIARKVSQFCTTGGPAAFVRLLGQKLNSTKYDKTFVEEAIDIVSRRVQADLENALKDKSFRHPANSISRKTIRKFSLERLRSSLTDSAPYLMLLLKGLIPKEPGSVEAWCPPSFAPNPTPARRARPAWLSASHLGTDSDTTSDQEPASDSDRASSLHSDMEPQFDSDSEWEDEPHLNLIKDPRSFIVTVGSMLMFMKSQQSNCFQMIMGKCHDLGQRKTSQSDESGEMWSDCGRNRREVGANWIEVFNRVD